eukprot:257619-Pleurochrysis_carterae.AAC.1
MSALRWRVAGKYNRGGCVGQWRRYAAPQVRLNSLSSAPSIACTGSSQRCHCSRVLKECAPLHPERLQSDGSNGRPHSSVKLRAICFRPLQHFPPTTSVSHQRSFAEHYIRSLEPNCRGVKRRHVEEGLQNLELASESHLDTHKRRCPWNVDAAEMQLAIPVELIQTVRKAHAARAQVVRVILSLATRAVISVSLEIDLPPPHKLIMPISK